MKHIHLTRVFAVLAFAGVVCSLVHVARAEDAAPAFGATFKSGAHVTLTFDQGKCPDDMRVATYIPVNGDPVGGCWKPINSKQALVQWDDGEMVAMPLSMFHQLTGV